MKFLKMTSVLTAFFVPLPVLAAPVTFDGITFPQGLVSFADAVVSTDLGAGTFIPPGAVNGDPNQALGAPSTNEAAYTLGVGGSIVLRFTDNALTGSGDSSNDLHIFEVGPQVEDTFVEISTDGIVFLSVGKVFGSTSSIDIDPFLATASLDSFTKFSFVRLTDDPDEGTRNPNTQYAGADIDAIGAITSAPPVTTPDTTPVPLPASALMLLAGVGVLGAATRRTARRRS